MRIACPSCEAAYDVPDPLIARRRTVRCARCGREWANEPPAPPAEAPAPEATAPEDPAPEAPAAEVVVAEAAAAPQPHPPWTASAIPEARADQRVSAPSPDLPDAETGGAVRLAWIASLALLAALAFAAWHYRDDVMRVWPQSKAVYQVLGPTGR